MIRYWLYVWRGRGKIRTGWDFDTPAEAEAYFQQHMREEEGLLHIIKREDDGSSDSYEVV